MTVKKQIKKLMTVNRQIMTIKCKEVLSSVNRNNNKK